MITQLVLVLILSFLPAGISGAADHYKSLKEDNRLMELELNLASQPQIYLIFNLRERQVTFKSRGIVLKGLKIRKVEVWGGPDTIGEYRLLRKSALKKPGRKEVRPGGKEGESAMLLTMPGEDARALYWSFYEGLEAIHPFSL